MATEVTKFRNNNPDKGTETDRKIYGIDDYINV